MRPTTKRIAILAVASLAWLARETHADTERARKVEQALETLLAE